MPRGAKRSSDDGVVFARHRGAVAALPRKLGVGLTEDELNEIGVVLKGERFWDMSDDP